MSIKDELADDQKIVYDDDGIAESISFTTVKDRTLFDNQLAIFEENNTGLIMQDGLESNKSESTVLISRDLFDEVIKVDSNLFGCRIVRKKDGKEWEVQREIRKDFLSATLLCMTNPFNKGKHK